ncbi:hypothetical protein L226DRAFT_258595 [Lentinus tigrinus ALCF2SS1-7]|uniref:Uncharacterized protein n=1 Tax=Lentinus tigrinus ALCF2SS1-6 TaxID=1328759 RepID=A0A5C2RUC6_9APHY|nr:hypothetical protein L227DRAFT_588604 [Lentinus tigrinus ALCF2SS1-6]RPD70173.1 hypothetical protein L226DRAFT_258595 [Lentinus tigrinus ALCF2SS1-7]
MASTSAIESRGRDKRPAVPVLLEAFPAPPSFIPPSPLLSGSPNVPFARSPSPFHSPVPSPQQFKLPPSAPPSSPLPPVPGPSPITEHETLMFITAARSRRASKMSIASVSTYSQRDSVISASGSSAPSLSHSTSATPYDSARSIRSYSSTSSLSVPLARHFDRSPVIQPRIAEEDAADLTRLSLDDISMHSPLPESLSDDEKVLDISISRRRIRHGPNDSISSIDLSEISQFRDEETDVPPAPPLSPPATREQAAPTPTQAVRRLITSPPSGHGRSRRLLEKDLPPLPPAPLAQPPPPPSETPSLAPSLSRSTSLAHTRRSSSPDIQEILATTPRPRRKSSHGSGLRSRSSSRPARSVKRRPGEYGHEVRSAPASRRTSAVDTDRRTSAPSSSRGRRQSRPGSPTEQAYAQDAMGEVDVWDEDSFVSDYGVQIDQTGTPYELLDGDEEARLDRELDGGGSDSDSSLDLHTPLPQLMVKDGLLSPNSKLVQASRNTTPLPGERPGSVFSVASTVGSVMTKNGLFKDERDTVQRRVRHRDGKLLRGGIGLTTGLGWSDSEDEDAPAPLVRQLSSHSLKKRVASAASLRSANSVTRSYSEHMPESRMDEFGVLPKTPRTSAPPTSWQRPRLASGLDRRTSTSSSLSSGSSTSALSRTFSRASVSSHRSAPASYNRRGLEPPALTTNSLDHIREGEEPGFYTPSTSSSTASLATPITPADSPSQSRPSMGSLGSKRNTSKLDTLTTRALNPRDVVILNSPSELSTGQPSPSPSTASPRSMSVPRPLRLPQTQGSIRSPSGEPASARTSLSSTASSSRTPSLRRMPSRLHPPSSARAVPVPVPSVASAPPQDGIAFPLRSPAKAPAVARSSSASSAPPSSSRLKPRTGTGMVYRTTPNTPTTPTPTPAVRPSMLRMPSTTSLRSAKGVGVAM